MRLLAVTCAVLLAPAVSLGWGFDGHRRLTANLDEPFPEGSCLRGFLAQYTSQFSFQDQSCDPDRWRNDDPVECETRRNAPVSCEFAQHYLDVDYADPIQTYPREWTEAQARFGEHAVANGRVPWRVEEVYGQLIEAFRAKNTTQVKSLIAHLSHYVTDAFSPMHDTKMQPGACPECLHLRYESDMLGTRAKLDAITDAMRPFYGTVGRAKPRDHIFDAVILGQPLAQKLVVDDLNNRQNDEALFENSKEMTARRWADALTMLASLVGSAWVDAGKPLLTGMPQGCDVEFPQGEMVLKGYPLPLPAPALPDAGTVDEPDAGVSGGGETLTPIDDGAVGCGCGGSPVAALAPMLLLALIPLRMRRER